MVLKPNKREYKVTSYRPISLLAVFSKLFEKVILKRLLPILEDKNIIPDHQFEFRHKHDTPEQRHRIVQEIIKAIENKLYCSAVFLDISKVFDKVWHCGLLYKIKQLIPAPYYFLFKSFLRDRSFYLRIVIFLPFKNVYYEFDNCKPK